MKLYSIHTGNLKLDGGAMFGVVPKVLWSKRYPCDENNLCNWAMRCLLVVTNTHKVLIDTGMGNKQSAKFYSHYYRNETRTLEQALAEEASILPTEITDVILTHLHFDHVGGAVNRTESGELEPAFKNAKYHVSKQQWDWAIEPNDREKASFLKENILPLKDHGVLNIVEEEGELLPNISVQFYHGHTDGQMVPFINYNGRTVTYPADLLPALAHIPMPWVMGYDTKPLITLKDKERYFKQIVDENMVIFFEHDLYNECATLQNTPKGVREKEAFTLAEME